MNNEASILGIHAPCSMWCHAPMACINEGQGHQELRPRLPIQSNGDSSSLCGEIETLADQHEEERGGENLEEMSKENTQNYEVSFDIIN